MIHEKNNWIWTKEFIIVNTKFGIKFVFTSKFENGKNYGKNLINLYPYNFRLSSIGEVHLDNIQEDAVYNAVQENAIYNVHEKAGKQKVKEENTCLQFWLYLCNLMTKVFGTSNYEFCCRKSTN